MQSMKHVLVTVIWVLVQSLSAAAAPVPDQVSSQLKTAVVEAEKKLGDLTPWQKRLFDEEVVPQYQRFVRDYRQTGSGVSAEIEMDVLKNYLRFYGPNFVKAPVKNLMVALKSDPICDKCVGSDPVIRGLIKARLERRGFVPSWLGPDDAAKPEKLLELAKLRNSAGFLFIEWAPEPVDLDSAHVDEKKYFVKLQLAVRDFDKQEGRLEVLENDAFETSIARLLTDAFTSFGAKAGQLNLAKNAGERREIFVKVSGFTNFAQYAKIKSVLEGYVKSSSPILEKRIEKGRITLAILGEQTHEEVQKWVGQTLQDPGVSAMGTLIKVEVE